MAARGRFPFFHDSCIEEVQYCKVSTTLTICSKILLLVELLWNIASVSFYLEKECRIPSFTSTLPLMTDLLGASSKTYDILVSSDHDVNNNLYWHLIGWSWRKMCALELRRISARCALVVISDCLINSPWFENLRQEKRAHQQKNCGTRTPSFTVLFQDLCCKVVISLEEMELVENLFTERNSPMRTSL